MSWPSVYVSTSLTSGMSAALILTSSLSYTLARGAAVRWGHSTYDDCRAGTCQTAYLNSLEDFCLWAPSQPDLDLSALGNTELTLTAWCVKSTHGARLIPDGTVSWAHFVKTPEYIQITGTGNLTNINAPADNVASASGEGNHVPGLVFTSAYGQLEQIYDWMSFVSQERFCFRAYNPSAIASTARPQIYDISGCTENVDDKQVVEDCTGDTTHAPCNTQQQVLAAPLCDSASVPSSCTTRRAIGDKRAAHVRRATVSTSGSSIPLASSTATSTNAMTIATSQSNATALTNSTPAPTTTPRTFNRTHGHSLVHSRSHRRSHHHFTTSSAPVLFSSSYSPTYSSSSFSFSHPPSRFSTPSSTSSTLTTSSHFTPDPPSSVTSSVTSTPTSSSTSTIPTSTLTPTPTPSSPSFYGTSSSLSGSSQPSSYSSPSPPASTPSTTPTSTSSTIITFTSPSTLSQSSDPPTFTTSISPSSDSISPSTSLPIIPNSATQLGSQCPPISQDVVDAGSTTSAPSLCVICMILMIVISSVFIL